MLGLLVVCAACTSARSAFDARLERGEFAFVMGEGSGWHGYDVLRIAATGECWYTFSELDASQGRVVWREAAFSIDAERMALLKQALNDTAFFSLRDEYRGPAVSGRPQWFFKVRTGEHRKAVFLDNEFPVQAVHLHQFVSEKLLDPHRDQFKTARIVPRKAGEEAVRF
jgi:hypothetical protein